MCFIRFPILLIGFFITFYCVNLGRHPDALTTAQNIVRYNLTVVADLICILLLIWLTRKEGIRLRDLLCLSRRHLLRDLLLGVAMLFITYIVTFAFYLGAEIVVYGPPLWSNSTLLQDMVGSTWINPLGLPWHILITMLILPVSAGFIEEMTYRGYALPRLLVFTKRKWVAVPLMALGFGIQHIAFGLISWQLALTSFIATFLAGLVFGILYLLTKQRLLSLVILHWQMDFISLGIAPFVFTSGE